LGKSELDLFMQAGLLSREETSTKSRPVDSPGF